MNRAVHVMGCAIVACTVPPYVTMVSSIPVDAFPFSDLPPEAIKSVLIAVTS
jgi:hypothetical protein